ncbi:TetR/AcrR family transcriptional regulator [Antrihabitans stalactiti]|uniref:TetR/AcrR family transcriptional regulator n=1 Tax=Antrihabitans stalactiti TaxID=2584121 RepID=A0A848KAF0_9NOCA|nr:TetR/AcrR family transcriptional regulator [Antrihabitans stalactiti]NMN95341.1 TetR/AcrR family transcriptional regulator [Antrihabitans stalactiti]
MATQRERSERTIAAILAAGRELFAADGYDEVTIDAVVAQAGIAKGAFYHHFSSKKTLLDAVVDEMQGEIADEFRANQRPQPLSANDLADVLTDYLRRAADPRRRRIVLLEGPEVLGWERWREIDDRHFAGMTRAAVAMTMSSAPDAPRVVAATQLVLGAVMEAALVAGRADDPEAVVAQFGDVLGDFLSGLAASR